tara:strand:+ start:777 stop:1004 length:228 start_codon:yes stop_codon:yes gene_type:complete
MKLKEELLKMLRDEMMDDDKHEMMEGMFPEKKMKATIMADDKEGLLEGAKELPDALSKAEEFMKARMGDSKKDKK